MARLRVLSGQKFQKLDSLCVWEVMNLTPEEQGIQHARLIRVDDPTSSKMISVFALRDHNKYRLLPN